MQKKKKELNKASYKRNTIGEKLSAKQREGAITLLKPYVFSSTTHQYINIQRKKTQTKRGQTSKVKNMTLEAAPYQFQIKFASICHHL
jgi:hypothetical protein